MICLWSQSSWVWFCSQWEPVMRVFWFKCKLVLSYSTILWAILWTLNIKKAWLINICLQCAVNTDRFNALTSCCTSYITSLLNSPLLSVVAQWQVLVPSIRRVAGSNPTLTSTSGPWASPSLAIAYIMWCGALCGFLAAKFDSCNNFPSSVHFISVIQTVSVTVWNIKNTKIIIIIISSQA